MGKDVEKLEPVNHWWECKIVHLEMYYVHFQMYYEHLENSPAFLKRLNTVLAYDPAISLLGTYQRKLKTQVHMKTCTQSSQKHYS